MVRLVVIGVLGLLLGASSEAIAENECPELNGGKPQQQMEYLQRDRSALKAACITYAMFQLASASGHANFDHYPETVKTIARYLDYRPPDASPLSRVVSRNRAPYPAFDALFMIGKPAVPDLIEAIANPATLGIPRFNAISLIFAIYSREDLPESVRVLKRAAKARESTDWEASQRLVDAARQTAGMCRGETAAACVDALYNNEGEARKP